MAMTMADMAASTQNKVLKAVVDIMLDDAEAGGGNLLQILPVENVDALSGIIIKATNEGDQAGVGTRPVNGTYTEGTVNLVNDTYSLGIVGGDIKIDHAFLKVKNYFPGAEPVALQTSYKAKAINRYVNNMALYGDKGSNPNGFNGLKKFLDPKQIVNPDGDIAAFGGTYTNGMNASTSNATAQVWRDFLYGVDAIIDWVGGGKSAVLIGNWYFKWQLLMAAREKGFMATTRDSYDRTIETYRGVPIIIPGAKNPVLTNRDALSDTNAVIPNNFTYGTQAKGTQVFAVRKGDDGVMILQASPLTTTVVAEHMQAQPAKLIRMDWYVGLYAAAQDAVAMLANVQVKA